MAVTKTHPIKRALKAAIDYICNPAKTDGKLLVSSFGCAAETADIEFAWTRRHAIDKGKSYIEHQAARNGTSYKAKLKVRIDRLLPGCRDFEELLSRLQREGYEIKRGKYVSVKAPGQERFTRLKTLGMDYTEEALVARIAGHPRPSRHPKEHNGKINLLIDIQNNIKAQQSAGYKRWATIENLKRFAETSNFLTEHGITSYGELAEKYEAVATACDRIKSDLREINVQMDELTLKMKYAATYRQLRPVYERYKASRDKEKFLRGNESDIILFEAAARELKRMGAVPLPTTERMNTEMDALDARKAELKTDHQQAQREQRQYAAIRKNVDEFLSAPAPEQQHQRKQELE